MRHIKLASSLAILLGLSATQAHAQFVPTIVPSHLVIVPTFDSTITNDPNAAQIEASINSICALYSKVFTNPITVTIYFQEVPDGLGTSAFFPYQLSYSDYRTALLGESSIAAILAPSLPASGNPASGNPVPGNADAGVEAVSAQLRAIGSPNGLGDPRVTVNGVNYDSEISLKTSAMNLSRSGPQDPNKYDIISVTEHEVNEVLGLSSALDGQTNSPVVSPVIVSNVDSLDFFRYAASGDNNTANPVPTNTRSFTNDPNAISYFSLDGGDTILNYFNQRTGGDFHDWASAGEAFDQAPQPQNAFTPPGVTPNLGTNEILALQAVGYNKAPAVLSNVTAQVTGNMGGPIYNRRTKLFNQSVTITITGDQPFLGPVSLVLGGLTSGVTLANKTGTTGGSPYITVSPNDIVAGSVLTVNLQFSNPTNTIIGYTPTVLAGGTPN